MGLNASGTKLLLYAKREGVNFEKTITIGRQGLHLTTEALQKNLNEYGYSAQDAAKIFAEEKGYAEPLYRLMGAAIVHSIDASKYEAATHIHDMNTDVPAALKNKYSVVLDGGSLEHVFNFPVAVKNCMEMLEVGGYYLGITPTNNFLGHGFYQFSPELYFRIFNAENGFQTKHMLFFVDRKNTRYYEVKDPNEVRARVILSNKYPSYLFVMAQKVATVPIFAKTPQQSDYQHLLWEGKGNIDQVKKNERKISLGTKFTNSLMRLFTFNKETGDGDDAYFKKIEGK